MLPQPPSDPFPPSHFITRTPSEQLAVLERVRLLRLPGESTAFDEICRLTARALNVPLTLVSLVTEDQQIFSGMDGTLPEPWHSARGTPLSHSFCQHVAHRGKPLIITDSREHPLVRDNPAVNELNVIAYAGMPLTTASGHSFGSLCAIDHRVREWTVAELDTLKGLAALVMTEIELRIVRNQLQRQLTALQVSEEGRNDRVHLLVHDLRTPLNSLLLGLETLPLLGEMNADQSETLEVALRGGKTLVSLVDNLLDVAAAENRGAASLNITRQLDTAELIALAVAQVAAMAAHGGVTLSIEPIQADAGDSPGMVDADADKIVRALVNLLSNAVKFTPAGGRVNLSVRLEKGSVGEVFFCVRDTGVGISREDQARLFERFGRIENQRGGKQRSSGLGLFFVRSVAEAHGGRVVVESEVGAGSRFCLVIPQRQPGAGK